MSKVATPVGFLSALMHIYKNMASKFPNLLAKDGVSIEMVLRMLKRRELKKVRSDRSDLFSVRFDLYSTKLTDEEYKTVLFY